MTSNTSKSIERLNSDKILLDNLSTILPDEFKLDQIIGEFHIFPVSLSFNFPVFNFKKIVFLVMYSHISSCGWSGSKYLLRDVNTIYDLFNKFWHN